MMRPASQARIIVAPSLLLRACRAASTGRADGPAIDGEGAHGIHLMAANHRMRTQTAASAADARAEQSGLQGRGRARFAAAWGTSRMLSPGDEDRSSR